MRVHQGHPEPRGRLAHGFVAGHLRIEVGDPLHARRDLLDQFEALAAEVQACRDGHAGRVATGSREACHEAECHRVGASCKDDRNRARCADRVDCGDRASRRPDREDQIHLARHRIGIDRLGACAIVLGTVPLEHEAAPVFPAEVAQAVHHRTRMRVRRIRPGHSG